MLKSFRVVLLVALIFTGWALAQSFLGSITGVVVDSTGSVVPNAKVEATEVTKGVTNSASTNNEGRYSFPDLTPGTYIVTIGLEGFKSVRSSQLILTAQQTVRFDATLEVGASAQSIEVTATPPTMNLENAELGDLRTHEELVNMPTQRSLIQMLFLNSAVPQGDGSSEMVGGLRGNYTNYTVDGITTFNSLWGGRSGPLTDAQSFEGIREVKVMESNNTAEFPGVATIMTATKSGENQFHGSGFFITDNSALDAVPFLQDPSSKGIGPQFHWFGASIGGPVYLPKIYNGRNKTFFFFDWEGRNWPLAAGNIATFNTNVPTADFRKGDFSKLDQVITDPTTGKPFPGNIIPSGRISSVAQAFQQYYVDPNAGPADSYVGNYQGTKPRPETAKRFDVRIDHHLSDRDALSGRVTRQIDPMPNNFEWQSNTPIFGHSLNRNVANAYVSETHTFTPALLNEFRIGFSRDFYDLLAYHDGAQVVQQVGLQGVPAAPAGFTGFPAVFIDNFGGLYDRPQNLSIGQTWELLNNVTWQKGAHNIKAGVLVRYARPQATDTNNRFGTYDFTGFATGFSYADFLLGIPHDTARVINPPDRYNRFTDPALFVQDTWNVTRKLTLNLGMRWEYFMPPVDNNDRRYAFDPKTGGLVVPNTQSLQFVTPLYPAEIPIVTAQQAGFPGRSLMYGNKKNFGPRASFAYRLGDRTVVRGGYGIYYVDNTYAVMDNFAGGPFGTREYFTNSITNGVPFFAFPNPFAGSLSRLNPGDVSVTGTDTHLRTPRTQQWSLTVERDLGHSLVARASYRGFMSTQIPYIADLTLPPASANPNNNSIYLYPNFSQVTYSQDGGIQKMNALDLAVERKFSNGLTFQAAYTLAKDRTDVGNDGESDTPENPYNRARDMANIQFVPRNRFTGNVLWEIPFGQGKRFGGSLPKAANAVLGNWQTSWITVMDSGQFLTPTYDGNQPNVRASSLRTDCVGSWSVSNPSMSEWFNPAAFAIPAAGQYGDCSRGIIHGPGMVSFNVGLFKSFNLTEKMRMKFEARAMNAFNHLNPGNPSTDISDTQGVGRITDVRTMFNSSAAGGNGERHIQLGLRFEF